MRRLLVLGAVAAALAGCSATETGEQDQSPAPSAPVRTSATAPPEPEPVADGPCPYLDTDEVSQSNGQQVAQVRLSADEPHPSCFFYRPDGEMQLTVRVYVGDPKVAMAIVDEAAPVDTSNPTSQPAGWEGGYESTDEGAVYAVAKDGSAVIVTTNQQQSVKARSVATQAISGLGI
ncbi:DUF2020 domain-containing protein [Prauserella cavernicola]|uniref:DUF2020 domain-containing protein n=1 Tax=Prauserella cavernicola TaxID=2800127 RepID=A0A934QQJ1_9PSEU|nr:DUF2020 domain-containing protein [Prauserella cavernicola]MBK1784530.1 DUF2020 domain-containing protein [Prauserella cavernicola]